MKTSSCSLPKAEVIADASDASDGLPSTLYTHNPYGAPTIPGGCQRTQEYINGFNCTIPIGEVVDIPLPLKIELNPTHYPAGGDPSIVCKNIKLGITTDAGYTRQLMQTYSPRPGVQVSLEGISNPGQGCDATVTAKVRISSDETMFKAREWTGFSFYFGAQYTRCDLSGSTECQKSLTMKDDIHYIDFGYRYPSGHKPKPKPQLALKAYLVTSSGGSRSSLSESSGSVVGRDRLMHSASSATRVPMGGTSVQTTQLPIGGTSLGTTSTLPSPTEVTTVINKLTFEDLQTGLTPNSDYKIRVDVDAEMERLIEKGRLQVGKGPLADLLSTAEAEAEGRTSWAILERGKVYARLIPQGVSDTLEVRVLQGAATQGLLKGLGIATAAAAASSAVAIGSLVLTTVTPASERGTTNYEQQRAKAERKFKIAISEEDDDLARMRVQLQFKKITYESHKAYASLKTGVTVAQVMALLWAARKDTYGDGSKDSAIESRYMGKKDQFMKAAYKNAVDFVKACRPHGWMAEDKRTFLFIKEDKTSPRFDIENRKGWNLRQ
ncbi:MAG TPA: hypothetical protein VGZ00_00010 [Candidatus Baltobacteraceae bacterium]|jgi:hypothetical protein|nr:hypothetical protein [Candidatus Baltobacteraceae bacterium]